VGQAQPLPLHCWPAAQATPQPPQLLASRTVSTQEVGLAAGQAAKAGAQDWAQWPAEQTWPAAQALPQAPQFRLSDLSSAQLPPQATAAPKQSGLVAEQPETNQVTATTTTTQLP
jgi:hypothetical protein